MLKGYIFKEQTFNNEVCALIFNEYLNNSDGIFGNYKNAMAVTKSGSNVTIANGVGIIKGRAVGEDSSTTLDAGTTEMYCKLVIEMDLDKVNTSSSFLQASYKIIKSASAYPALTQDNIIGTNSGVYQYELARFRTGTNGITDFQDMRTYIDIPTMYEQVVEMVQNAIDSIEDGSAFALKSEMVYSTNEVDTGKTWIDGKTIYRKVVDLGQIGSANNPSEKTIAGNFYDTIVHFDGHMISANGEKSSLNRHYTNGNWIMVGYDIKTNHSLKISIDRNDSVNWADWSIKIIIEYTKTTD